MKKNMKVIIVAAIAVICIVGILAVKFLGTSGFDGTPIDYANLEIEEPALIEVTDEEIELALDNLLAANLLYSDITDRAIEEGDILNIDYAGYLDGEAFDGGTAENVELTVGAGLYIDGFEEGLIGYYAGDEVTLDLVFPDDYGSETLAGQAVVFEIVINGVYETMLPELTDEFIDGISDTCSTIEEYKAELTATYEAENLATQNDSKKSLIWTAIVEGTTVNSYPEDEIQATCDYLYELYEYYASLYGLTIEEYVAMYDMTTEEYDQIVLEAAQQTYISDQIITYIGEKEGLTPTAEEYQAEIDEIVVLYGYTDEASFYEAMQVTREEMELEILSDTVLTWLVDNVTYVTTTEDTTETAE